MSGLFGVVHLDGRPVEGADLDRMSLALAHHGADGVAIRVSGPVGLGQRSRWFTPEDRLDRPALRSADGSRLLVADVRIDNRRELLADLEGQTDRGGGIPGETAQGGDAGLLLAAFDRWGEECVDHVVGVYAFALWDERERRLFLARSPIVAPALFYHEAPGLLAFATMPSGLLALPFVPRALNEAKLASVLAERGGVRDETLYRGILSLPTGHVLAAGPEGLKRRCFWQPDPKREIRFARDEEYVEAFRELFERVVSDHLRSASPVGAMMSGGLDSSAVSVTAARLLEKRGERLATFTEVPLEEFRGPVPEGRYADETPYVRAIAGTCRGLDLNLVRAEGRTFLDDADRLCRHLEHPFRNTSNRVWLEAILSAARDRGIAVLLDGMQGNLTLSWDGGGLLPGLLWRGRWGQAVREATAMARRGTARSPLQALVGRGLMPLLPEPVRRGVDRLRGRSPCGNTDSWRIYSAINPSFAVANGVTALASKESHACRFGPPPDTREIRCRALAGQDGGPYLSAFRSCFGIDLRSPTADVRIAEFCLALPEDQFLFDGVPRSLIRRAMAGRLPSMVLENRLRGLQAADWFERSTSVRGQIAVELERLERSELAQRVLDLERMRLLVERWPTAGGPVESLMVDYRYVLARGLMAGSFLLWFEAGGAGRTPGGG